MIYTSPTSCNQGAICPSNGYATLDTTMQSVGKVQLICHMFQNSRHVSRDVSWEICAFRQFCLITQIEHPAEACEQSCQQFDRRKNEESDEEHIKLTPLLRDRVTDDAVILGTHLHEHEGEHSCLHHLSMIPTAEKRHDTLLLSSYFHWRL